MTSCEISITLQNFKMIYSEFLIDIVVDLLFQFTFFLRRHHRPQLYSSETFFDFRYFPPLLCPSGIPKSLSKMIVSGAGGAGGNMVDGGSAFSYEVDRMSMVLERY